jgi:predicted neuraminidase
MKILQHETIYELQDKPGLVHCSSILETHEGSLVCVWYQGSYETASDTILVISRKVPGGDWSTPSVLFDFHGAPLGNPVLWNVSFDQRIFITFSMLTREDWKSSLLFFSSSSDGGFSWTAPQLFLSKSGFMAKTQPVENDKKEVVFPLYHEESYCPYIYLIRDIDNPLDSFLSAETMARGKAIQPSLCRLGNDRILMATRTRLGKVYQSISHNSGYSWSILQPSTLDNPDSGIDIFPIAKDTVGIIYNPSNTDRTRLSLTTSKDGGQTWGSVDTLIEGEGEYSYPCVIVHADGSCSVTYTDSRYAIRYVHFRYEDER